MASAATKAVLLLLLALQVGFQPLLIAWYARDATDVRMRVAVVELLKLGIAVVPLMAGGHMFEELKKWRLRVALQTTATPALVYLLQNYLNQTAVVLLDGVTFNVLNQTKIIWTALLVYLMLGQTQSRRQILALAILCAAAVVMTTRVTKVAPVADVAEETDAAFVSGAYQALTAAVLSALAGTIIQRALQTQKRNPYMVTIELSVMGLFTLAVWTAGAVGANRARAISDGGDAIVGQPPSVWAGWTAMTFVAMLCQAFGGVLVGFVIKFCGNVEKSFAVVLGMVITAALEHFCNAKPFGLRGGVAVALVALSTALYTLKSSVQAKPQVDSAAADVGKPVTTKFKMGDVQNQSEQETLLATDDEAAESRRIIDARVADPVGATVRDSRMTKDSRTRSTSDEAALERLLVENSIQTVDESELAHDIKVVT